MAYEGFSDILCTFEKCLETPEDFAESQDNKAEIFKSMTKTLYDSIQRTNDSEEILRKVLPTLIIENFDDEQVWQQLELQNTPVFTYFNKCVKDFHLDDVTFGVKKSGIQSQHSNLRDCESNLSSDEGLDYAFDGSDSDDSEEQIPHESPVPKSQISPKQHRKFNSTSVVDDRFFKVSQLEEFLKYEDLKEERGQLDNGSDESDIDMFADIPSDYEAADNSNDERAQKGKSSKEIMYKDFFDLPEEVENRSSTGPKCDISETEVEKFGAEHRKRGSSSGKKNTVRFSQSMGTSGKLQLLEDSDSDSVLNENLKSEKSSSKTPFEKQQEKERKRMRELEKSLLKKKPWQFTGEVAADSRPQDSLLRQHVEFDSNPRQDFVSTDEITERVENIVKMAIINKAWCDVEVKEKPIEDVLPYKSVKSLDDTKSKVSLAEIYGNEFNEKQRKHEDEKEDPRHTEIRKLMFSVESTLAALFGHTPRPPVPEIKIVNNMPAITVEEVAPVGVSDATLLAPEEIKPKSGLPVGKSERTKTDKKRERRKKKKLQKIRRLEEEEKMKKKASTSTKAASKFAKQQALKKISQQKNVTIIRESKHVGKKR